MDAEQVADGIHNGLEQMLVDPVGDVYQLAEHAQKKTLDGVGAHILQLVAQPALGLVDNASDELLDGIQNAGTQRARREQQAHPVDVRDEVHHIAADLGPVHRLDCLADGIQKAPGEVAEFGSQLPPVQIGEKVAQHPDGDAELASQHGAQLVAVDGLQNAVHTLGQFPANLIPVCGGDEGVQKGDAVLQFVPQREAPVVGIPRLHQAVQLVRQQLGCPGPVARLNGGQHAVQQAVLGGEIVVRGNVLAAASAAAGVAALQDVQLIKSHHRIGGLLGRAAHPVKALCGAAQAGNALAGEQAEQPGKVVQRRGRQIGQLGQRRGQQSCQPRGRQPGCAFQIRQALAVFRIFGQCLVQIAGKGLNRAAEGVEGQHPHGKPPQSP